MSELKKCPHCGEEVTLINTCHGYRVSPPPTGEIHRFHIYCSNCKSAFQRQTSESGVQIGWETEEEARAAWNRRADEWIPVTERLPEVGKCVLIRQTYHAFLGEHGEYEGVTIGYLHQPTDRRCKPYFYYAAVSDYGDMVRAQSICPGSEFVTDWMPLPEPPKGATTCSD